MFSRKEGEEFDPPHLGPKREVRKDRLRLFRHLRFDESRHSPGFTLQRKGSFFFGLWCKGLMRLDRVSLQPSAVRNVHCHPYGHRGRGRGAPRGRDTLASLLSFSHPFPPAIPPCLAPWWVISRASTINAKCFENT